MIQGEELAPGWEAGSFGDEQSVTVRSMRPRRVIGLGLLLVLGLLLRLYHLGSQSVWIDEAHSLRLAALGPMEIIEKTMQENHPPLYFLALSAWMKFWPETEAVARLFSALLGTAFIAIFYRFCREILPGATSLLASAFLALSPWAVWHSQDARMYPLALVFSYLAFVLFFAYLRNGSLLRLAGFILVLLASLFTHFYAISIIPVLLIYLGWVRRALDPGRLHRMTGAIFLAGLCWMPWVVVILSVVKAAGFYKPITVLSLPYVLYAFSVGYTLGPSPAELRPLVKAASIPLHHLPLVATVALLFGTLLIRGLWELSRGAKGRRFFVLLLLAVPLLLPIAVTLVHHPIDFNARYGFIAFPAYLIVLATGLLSIRGRKARSVLGAGVLALMGWSLYSHYTDSQYGKEDARAAFRLVNATQAPGDCVLVIGIAWAYQYYEEYYEGTPVHSRWLDFRSPGRLQATEAALQEWRQSCQTLWLVSGRDWEEDPMGLAVPMLEKWFSPVQETILTGVRVVRFERSDVGRSDITKSLVAPKHY